MTRTRHVRLLAIVALIALGLLTGCRGVPTSSAPQKVSSVGLGQGQPNPNPPTPGAGPREIVGGFLQANSYGSPRSASLQFLTKSAANSWSDSTATIVDSEVTGVYDADTHALNVTGRVIGALDKTGVFTPTLGGTGDGGDPQTFKFELTQVNGEYRISSAPNGLLLTSTVFDSVYQAHELYFYDVANRYLVPDIRYSSLDDPGALADWLLAQLVNGPRPTLTTAVSTDTLPTRIPDPQARIGAVTQVQIEGARQLSAAARDRLAAQVASTLKLTGISELTITDGGSHVLIPQVRGVEFSAANFSAALGPHPPARPPLYYLNGEGRIKQSDGTKLQGNIGARAFDSIALARPPQIGKLMVAGVVGQQLQISTLDAAWHPLSLHTSELSRPAWAPELNEVWIAAGLKLYRIVTNGSVNKPYRVALPPGAPSGSRVSALRISPDGSRIALVFANGQLFIGSILRNGSVSIAPLAQAQTQISPQDVHITDVAWADSLKLYATGYLTTTTEKEAGVFETSADGADWTDLGLSSLPGRANTITATSGAPAWVDANGYVWIQSGMDWLSPTSQDQTGTKPMYLG